MNAFKCDICGKFVELPNFDDDTLENEGIYYPVPMEIWNFKLRCIGDKYDICETCRDKIITLLKGLRLIANYESTKV